MSTPDASRPAWTAATMLEVAAEPTLALAAILYATLGVPVFPCVPGAKQPLTPNGFHDATDSVHVVRRWWDRTPDANIGLPTGACTGVVVVDVDVHGDDNGFGGFERARTEGLAEGWGWLVRTPSGGIHAYYPAARGPEQRSWQAPTAHIDFRGAGGYIIAPPSEIRVDGSKRRYDVVAVATHQPHTIDAAGLRHFLEPPRPTRSPPTSSLTPTGCRPDALARTVAMTVEGGRNRALFWASCRMAESGLEPADALNWLMPAAQRAGLGDREIESTINSAFRTANRLSARNRPGLTPANEGIRL